MQDIEVTSYRYHEYAAFDNSVLGATKVHKSSRLKCTNIPYLLSCVNSLLSTREGTEKHGKYQFELRAT